MFNVHIRYGSTQSESGRRHQRRRRGGGGGGWGLITEYVVMFKHFKVSGITGARCSSVVRAFAHGAMGRRIDPSWGGPMDLFLVPASAPRLV